jgi:hypothetical protein
MRHHIDMATLLSSPVHVSDGIDSLSSSIGPYFWDCGQLTSDSSSRHSW